MLGIAIGQMMRTPVVKTPVVLVSAALTVAILLAASFLIAAGTRGDDRLSPIASAAAEWTRAPAAK
jgi:hypothetical protein